MTKHYSIGKNKFVALHLVTFTDDVGPVYYFQIQVAEKALGTLIDFARLRRVKSRFKSRLSRILTALNPLPVYYMVDSRDCDHVRVISAHRASCGLEYMADRDAAFKSAEGPTYVYRITKADYQNHYAERRACQSVFHRDYIAEAYENGHPHSVNY